MDDYINQNNSVRIVDAYVDKLDLKLLGFCNSETAETGRPPYNPADILKLYIYGYMHRIRSSRRLEDESKRNIEVIWLLKKLSPDHKTIARFRSDNKKPLRNVFRDFVKLCMKMGLYGKEIVAVDGSKFKAVNSRERNFNEEKLKERLSNLETKINRYMEELDKNDACESEVEREFSAEEIKEIIKTLQERKTQYDIMMKAMKDVGESQVSLTDADSRRMMANGRLDVCYNVQTAVDAKNGLVVEFDVTNDVNDNGKLRKMALASKEMLEVATITAVADRGYDSATDMAECIKEEITPHVAMKDESIQICVETNGETEMPNSFESGRCIYLRERNVVVCPMGEILKPRSYHRTKRCGKYHNRTACQGCPMKAKCTAEEYKVFEVKMKPEEFTKVFNDQDLRIKQIEIKPNRELIRKRKTLSEHPFGILKRNMDSYYVLTKGKDSVSAEFALSFLALNMKRAINIAGTETMMEQIKRK